MHPVEPQAIGHGVDLVDHQQRVLLLDADLLQHLVGRGICSSTAGLAASATCSSRLACRASSSVALKLAIRWCGKSRMKPTVSLSSTGPQPGNCQRRVRVSSVANKASCDEYVGPRQGVHQRALAGVGVADQGNRHQIAAGRPPRAACGARSHRNSPPQVVDPVFDQAAVFFQLLFARPAKPDALLLPRQVRPHPLQPRHGVFQLGQFDRQPGLVGLRPGWQKCRGSTPCDREPLAPMAFSRLRVWPGLRSLSKITTSASSRGGQAR